MTGHGRALRLLFGCGPLLCALGCSGQDSYPANGFDGGSAGRYGAGAPNGGAAGGGAGASGAASGGANSSGAGGASSGGGGGGTDSGSAGCANTGVFRTETMYPGLDCSGCHGFKVTGTVYPRSDVPNYCDGTPAVTIEVTGSDGEVVTLTSNRVGNFESDRPLSGPYTVVLRSANGTRKPTHATNGNCNGCHTSTASGSNPGRILAP